MKIHIPASSFLASSIIALILPLSAETIVLRSFTLQPAEGQDPLTVEQIKDAITRNNLGQDTEVDIPIENSRFKHSNIKPIEFASEYNEDLTISKFDSKDLGVTIEGSTTKFNDHVEVKLSYSETTKTGDVIYGTKENRAILMPKFNSASLSSSVVLNVADNLWIVMTLSFIPESKSQRYIAFRIQN